MKAYRTEAEKAARTKQERAAAIRKKWSWLPLYTVDPDDPGVLVHRHPSGVVHRVPNKRQQLPFALPPTKEDA